MKAKQPIGVFDSGIGGLSVLKEIKKALPLYDYYYLGDNARVPYGNRSFETVYEYTKECVFKLWDMGCPLVVVACNTASAKALRNIQQIDLPKHYPHKKVLGVIRPTTETIGHLTRNGKVGLFATQGTVSSDSYKIEIAKFFPEVSLFQVACPMWVPLIENNEHLGRGADYFVEKYVQQLMAMEPSIDTILLACTHYPLLMPKIKSFLDKNVEVVVQGKLVADSLVDYLQRHHEIRDLLTCEAQTTYFTTDNPSVFEDKATLFLGEAIVAERLSW